MDLDNPDNRPVLRLGSDENWPKLLGEHVLNSTDFDSKGQLAIKTRYGQQEPPTFPRATKPNLQVRVPLGPRDGNGNGGNGNGNGGGGGGGAAVALAVQRGVGERVLGAEVANQEAEVAKLHAKLKYTQRECELLRKVLVGVIDLHMLTANGDGV